MVIGVVKALVPEMQQILTVVCVPQELLKLKDSHSHGGKVRILQAGVIPIGELLPVDKIG